MKRQVIVLSLLVMAGQAVPAFEAEVTVVTAYSGNKGPGWKSSIDVAGAVGPRHVVDFDEGGFVVHEKATGKEFLRFSTREFWQQVEPAQSLNPQKDPNDPRIIYDPLSERWFACAAGTTVPDCFLAVSTSSDPTQPWKGVKLPLPPINPYMKMGVDKNGLYICSCNGKPDLQQAMNCYVIPKSDAIAPGGPVLTHGQTFTNLQFSSMPAMDLDPSKAADAPEVLLANEFSGGTCDRLYLYRITWSGLTASISDVQIVPLSNVYQTPNNASRQMEAVQPAPGPKLHAGGGGRRNDSVFVHEGSVFGCNGAKRTLRLASGDSLVRSAHQRWCLAPGGFRRRPELRLHLSFRGRGSQGQHRSGLHQDVGDRVPVGLCDDACGYRSSQYHAGARLAVPGTTYYRYSGVAAVNWSHYTSTCIDPSNPDLLWTYQAYANSTVDRQWCTAWAAFKLSSSATKPVSSEVSAARVGPHGRTADEVTPSLTRLTCVSETQEAAEDRGVTAASEDGESHTACGGRRRMAARHRSLPSTRRTVRASTPRRRSGVRPALVQEGHCFGLLYFSRISFADVHG